MASETPWPSEIRLSPDKTTLNVAFESGERFALAAEYLRVESPSAEVQGHAAEQKKIVPGKRLVRISALEPVGNYAVRIIFDDGHDSGLFSWSYLHELGREYKSKWPSYLKSLKDKHLDRG
jgi:DUF971 family protein